VKQSWLPGGVKCVLRKRTTVERMAFFIPIIVVFFGFTFIPSHSADAVSRCPDSESAAIKLSRLAVFMRLHAVATQQVVPIQTAAAYSSRIGNREPLFVSALYPGVQCSITAHGRELEHRPDRARVSRASVRGVRDTADVAAKRKDVSTHRGR
jgi:hypothetical protein